MKKTNFIILYLFCFSSILSASATQVTMTFTENLEDLRLRLLETNSDGCFLLQYFTSVEASLSSDCDQYSIMVEPKFKKDSLVNPIDGTEWTYHVANIFRRQEGWVLFDRVLNQQFSSIEDWFQEINPNAVELEYVYYDAKTNIERMITAYHKTMENAWDSLSWNTEKQRFSARDLENLCERAIILAENNQQEALGIFQYVYGLADKLKEKNLLEGSLKEVDLCRYFALSR